MWLIFNRHSIILSDEIYAKLSWNVLTYFETIINSQQYLNIITKQLWEIVVSWWANNVLISKLLTVIACFPSSLTSFYFTFAHWFMFYTYKCFTHVRFTRIFIAWPLNRIFSFFYPQTLSFFLVLPLYYFADPDSTASFSSLSVCPFASRFLLYYRSTSSSITFAARAEVRPTDNLVRSVIKCNDKVFNQTLSERRVWFIHDRPRIYRVPPVNVDENRYCWHELIAENSCTCSTAAISHVYKSPRRKELLSKTKSK